MIATTTTVNRRRNIGRSPPCIKVNKEDYKQHIMKTVYMCSSMKDERARNSRSMILIGYFCSQCELFWTYGDLLNSI